MHPLSPGPARGAAALLLLAVFSAPAAAQGNGRGHAYGLANRNVSTSAPSGGAAAAGDSSIPGTGFRNFGSWLDDATVMEDGGGFVSLALSYWRAPSFREIDFPVIDGGLSLNRRVQFGLSAPYYYAAAPGAPAVRGLGDVYMNVKVQLKDPSQHRAGVAVSPVLEVLSAPLPGDSGRVHWGLPVSVEVRRNGWRTYGTAGYFSRGALFASGAVEVPVSPRAWVTAAISQSHSMKSDDLSFALGLSKNRTDVSGGLAFSLRPAVVLFGSIGRTISRQDASATSVMFTTGLSMSLDGR
jgi:hypothetical protein